MTPPTDKLRIGVVGLNFGQKLIDNEIAAGPGRPFYELVAVCDADPRRAGPTGQRLGVPAYHDFERLLADERVEAVGLFTGPAGRAELIRRAVRGGKHVISTKPFEQDAAAALSVLREARQLGKVVHLNSPRPILSPDLDQIQRWRDELSLGRPVAARGDIWCSYREKADGSWYDDPARCPVAPVLRLGIYLVNDLVRLIGMPQGVQVMRSRLFTGRPTDDNAQLGIRFADGTLANVFASFCVNDGQNYFSSLTLNFENGTVYRNVGPTRGPDPRRHPELSVVARVNDQTVTRSAVADGSSEDYPWEYFYHSVRGRRRDDETTPEQVAAGIDVLNAMRRAAASGAMEQVGGEPG